MQKKLFSYKKAFIFLKIIFFNRRGKTSRKLTLYLTLITDGIQIRKVKCSNCDDIGVNMLRQREIELFKFIKSKTIIHLRFSKEGPP